MMKTLIATTILALDLDFLSTPSFASGYIVNGHAASPAEAQQLVASSVQQGAWVVDGYGIAPAERASFTPPPALREPRQDVLLRPRPAALRAIKGQPERERPLPACVC